MAIASPTQHRNRLTLQGTVQGVGFRPFVYRLATMLELVGGVKNTSQGVVIEIEGSEKKLESFRQRLLQELPPHATIQTLTRQELPTQGFSQFQIWSSETNGDECKVQILPDLATCPECLQDICRADNRRSGYAFTNCTHCGPRFSIITALPYDRPHTTMAAFSMCPDCQAEYTDPRDRRFHAQPNACPNCGPQLINRVSRHNSQHLEISWQKRPGFCTHVSRAPIHLANCQGRDRAIAALQQSKIVALKGLGGFQLLVDAQNPAAVNHLRQRKGRPDKPLALMYPTLAQVRRDCLVSETAATVLTSAQAPIVLLPQRVDGSAIADGVAPKNPYLGVMLPTTPLHHLLLRQYGSPLVTTSGNRSGEPICIDEQEAHEQLDSIADEFLSHNRPIQRSVDDSVVQIIQGRPQILRHARGYAPQAIQLAHPMAADTRILAVGAHLKNAIALSLDNQVVLSQHIGDLDTPQAIAQLQQTVTDFLSLYACQPTAIACDRHPDYGSTQLARTLAQQWDLPLIPVQHHYAHALASVVEHRLSAPVLGIAWDGTGYGLDQTVWGGEFLWITEQGFERVAHLLPFPLPGGDACSREPRRSALGLLYRCYGQAAFEMTDLAPVQAFTATQRLVLQQMLSGGINTPMSSSMGRLFDGIAALLNLYQLVSFEGQAAMALEFAIAETAIEQGYPFTITGIQPYLIDWRPMVQAIVCDHRQGIQTAAISAKFHRTLVNIMLAIAQRINIPQIILTGGCFQNRHLSEQAIQHLGVEGFIPYWHQRIPPNDGGIAVGQVLAALRHLTHA